MATKQLLVCDLTGKVAGRGRSVRKIGLSLSTLDKSGKVDQSLLNFNGDVHDTVTARIVRVLAKQLNVKPEGAMNEIQATPKKKGPVK